MKIGLSSIKKFFLYLPTIGRLSRWELKLRYAGTFGGIIWLILLPLTMALVYWYVFAVGLRAQGPDDTPYILWFLCGFIPWLSFNETLLNNVTAISRNAHLVKNVIFPLEILPIVNLVVSQVTHLILLLVLFVLLISYHVSLTLCAFQLIYYYVALLFLSNSLSFIVSALNVFCRDLAQALSILLNILFWITPIVWAPNLLPPTMQKLLLFNPVYYIVNGYRESFLYPQMVWHHLQPTVFFWMVNALLFMLGLVIFRWFRSDFADAL